MTVPCGKESRPARRLRPSPRKAPLVGRRPMTKRTGGAGAEWSFAIPRAGAPACPLCTQIEIWMDDGTCLTDQSDA